MKNLGSITDAKDITTKEYVETNFVTTDGTAATGSTLPTIRAADTLTGITGATEGQMIYITAVNSLGQPTAWAAVDAPTTAQMTTAINTAIASSITDTIGDDY